MLTPAELAAHLRVSERTVARMVTDGCPYHRVRSQKRFQILDVASWLAMDRQRLLDQIPTPVTEEMRNALGKAFA